jgi:hypothetical protein
MTRTLPYNKLTAGACAGKLLQRCYFFFLSTVNDIKVKAEG